MPTRTDDALLMARAGLLVAAVAVPLAVAAGVVARRTLGRVCPAVASAAVRLAGGGR